MTVQLLRSKDGKATGLVIFFRKRGVILAAGDRDRAWRICDRCKTFEAMVFCQTHGKYICEGCLGLHQAERRTRCGALLSIAAIRESIERAVVGWP